MLCGCQNASWKWLFVYLPPAFTTLLGSILAVAVAN
jgi:hypothetical protein